MIKICLKIKTITLLLSLGSLFLTALPAAAQVAQQVGFSGSPNPVGSGARALGMGGAFIAIADDATAASWNPGGLIQLESPEISMVLSYDKRSEERSFSLNPGASGSHAIELADINYLSLAYPFTLFYRNVVASLNYQTMYDFNREIETNYYYSSPPLGPRGNRQTTLKYDGYLKALSPAFAVQITPTFSLGLTMNWFSKDLGCEWEMEYHDRLVGTAGVAPFVVPFTNEDLYREKYEFDGVNFNLGLFWNINHHLTLGLVYKTPFDADIHHKEEWWNNGNYTVPLDEDQTMRMPQSYGIGLAWRFSDYFTMDLDIYRTDWQDYVLVQASGREISLFTGQERYKCDTQPTHQVRLGGEYLFIMDNYVVPVRSGIFYDPEPTAYNPDDFYGFSVGSGIAWESLVLDIAYQFRWGNDVRDVRLGKEVVGQEVKQHTVYMSLIYHF